VLPVVRYPYFALMGASLAVSALFLVLFVTGHAFRGRSGVLALLVLAGSKSFVDYSTSGLENPLSHLVVAWGFRELWDRPGDLARLRRFALATSLAGLDRLDLVLLFLPALLAEAWARWRQHPARRVFSALALGFAPLVVWEAFSLVYYGALVPNTAYAKLATGIPIGEYFRRGWYYLRSTSAMDPAGILALVAAPLVALAAGRRTLGTAAAGLLLALAYVFRVGGDYMAGRYFTPLIVLASCILARAELAPLARRAFVLVFLAAGALPPLAPWRSDPDYDVARVQSLGIFRPVLGIMDERGLFYSTTGFLRARRTRWNDHEWVRFGEELSRTFDSEDAPVVLGPLGMEGFHAGPRVPVHDYYGLTDPLLARLPLSAGFRWRIGHFLRAPPAGYGETLASGSNRLRDPDLAAFHELLQQVTRAELWSPARWRAMWSVHFGAARTRFDAYCERYARGEVELDRRPR
jgi:arabinofuranosyltransferase